MCGIFFSLSASGPLHPDDKTVALLKNRGPDSFHIHTIRIEIPKGEGSALSPAVHLTFAATVLALRGDHVQPQPLIDAESRSVLCWNGEAWSIAGKPVCGNDTAVIFNCLLETAKEKDGLLDGPLRKLITVFNSLTGPFSFVFYDGFNMKVYFGRDCLGRRSLLQSLDQAGNIKICSICDGSSSISFNEVETDGIHMIDLTRVIDYSQGSSDGPVAPFRLRRIPWMPDDTLTDNNYSLRKPIPMMNKAMPGEVVPLLKLESPCLEILKQKLHQAVQVRLQNVPEPPPVIPGRAARIAVLFSGGLDCTLLARLAHDILPISEAVDLLNVAFENPRVAAASANDKTKLINGVFEDCPDRITGRAGHAELQRVCPKRLWRFVAIDVPYTETLTHRNNIKHLMRPHNTEMDLSIACALYFASRGKGIVSEETKDGIQTVPFTTAARVLLSGLGADELFAGYTRHAVAFARHGFSGLIHEIDLDVSRLGTRNLGRDDRVISHWGREARYPYLDEEFLAWVTQAPIWERCGFGMPISHFVARHGDNNETSSNGTSQGADIEPGKMALRLIAFALEMNNVAIEKKRAIQFGSRTAKMESGRSKGTQLLS